MYACLYAPGNLPLLIECAGYFSPWIESVNDSVVFDIRGLGLIFGTPREIATAIERRMGLRANLAIASNPDAAMHAARGINGTTVIDPGREAEVLARLPLFLLGGSPEFAQTMDLWGVRTFGGFAALPPLGVAARLGDEGIPMQRLARGEGNRLLRTPKDPLEFVEEMEPEATLDLMEPLLLLIGRMLGDVCARIAAHSLSADQLRLKLKLERASDYHLTLDFPVPMIDVQVFLKLLQLELAAKPPLAPIERIRIELKPVEPRVTQHGLFLPTAPEPQKLEITLARIRNLVGAANLGSPELIDTHRPDSFRLRDLRRDRRAFEQPNVEPLPLVAALYNNPTSVRFILRRFRPPQYAQVWRSPDGQPARISSSKAQGRVLACAGPWHTSGDWWTIDPWNREEWDIETAASLLRIHRDCRRGEWFVEGSYD
jgi:protein ImuB